MTRRFDGAALTPLSHGPVITVPAAIPAPRSRGEFFGKDPSPRCDGGTIGGAAPSLAAHAITGSTTRDGRAAS